MINWDVNRIKWRLSFLYAALALTLAGCVPPSGYGGSTSPGGYISPDPYHYRCTGNCQAGS